MNGVSVNAARNILAKQLKPQRLMVANISNLITNPRY